MIWPYCDLYKPIISCFYGARLVWIKGITHALKGTFNPSTGQVPSKFGVIACSHHCKKSYHGKCISSSPTWSPISPIHLVLQQFNRCTLTWKVKTFLGFRLWKDPLLSLIFFLFLPFILILSGKIVISFFFFLTKILTNTSNIHHF